MTAQEELEVKAVAEIVSLQRRLLKEIYLREQAQGLTRRARYSRKLREEENVALKKKLEETELRLKESRDAWDQATTSLENLLKAAEAKVAELVTENMLLKDAFPKMKENRKGYPSRCLRCGKSKGSRAYTCPKCFEATHLNDKDPDRKEWSGLMQAWGQGQRDFPRF